MAKSEGKEQIMDLSKEELLGSIQQKHQQLKEKRAFRREAALDLKNRTAELPAFKELEQAKQTVKIAQDKLNAQCDEDETWLGYSVALDNATKEVDDLADLLSELLVLWTAKTKSKAVHADLGDPVSVDRAIEFRAKVSSKKVSANLSLFDEEEPDDDA